MKRLILAVALAGSMGMASIVDTNRYSDIESYLKPDTLVVTDLDNTVFRPVQTIGSDQWGVWRQKAYADQGYPKNVWVERGVSDFSMAQFFTRVTAVEDGIPTFLKSLEARGIPVVALTARPMNLIDRTVEELESIKVKFTTSPILDTNTPDQSHAGVVIKGGVIFVGPFNEKGPVLSELLAKNVAKNGHQYKQIIFIDDKLHNVESIEKAFQSSNVDFTGLRYGATDEIVKSFNPDIAGVEWDIFLKEGKIISDTKAQEILNGN